MSYSMISSPELTAIARLPKSAILIYLALSQHAREQSSVFPSIKRLLVVLGGALSKRSVYDGLKALVDAGIIERAERTSSRRFHLKIREMWMSLRESAKSRTSDAKPRGVRKRKKKSSYNYRNKNLSFQRSQAEQPPTPKATLTERPTPPPEDNRAVVEIKEILQQNVFVSGMDERLLSAFTEQRDWDWLKRMKPKYWDYLRTKRSKR
jgi:Fe2+ or Zn2+ uptake regulation protein